MHQGAPSAWTGGVPDSFWLISAAALGAVVGSFLNVCIYRMPRRCMTIAYPKHSRCPACGHGIRWYENVPVVSWLFLMGKCSSCRSPISPLYPFVEALTAALFSLCALRALELGAAPEWMKLVTFAVAAWFSASLIVATFVDFEFQIIPDQISITGTVLAPLVSLFAWWIHLPVPDSVVIDLLPALPAARGPFQGLLSSLVGAAAGAGSIWFVGFLGKLAFRKDAMGMGDVKLMAFVGGLLGWIPVLCVFFIACLLGSFVGILQMLFVKLANAFRKVPVKFDHYLAFGPYLAVGALIMFFFRGDVLWLVLVRYREWLNGLFISS